MKRLNVFVSVCVSLGVYVCQHEYFRGPTLSGGDRASPERGHAALQGGGLEGLDRERERGSWGRPKRKQKGTEKRARSAARLDTATFHKQEDSHRISYN